LDESSDVNLRISIGGIGKAPKDKEKCTIPLEYKRKTNSFRYKKVQVEEIVDFSFPIDPS
jgi:hypothetical protein